MAKAEQSLDDRLHQFAEWMAAIEDCERTGGWRLFTEMMTSLRDAHQKLLLGGQCESWERYKYEAGYIHGCTAALSAFDDLRTQHRDLLAVKAELDQDALDDVLEVGV
jgi:hypothetical protein